jgi:hypothetical protein
MESGSARKRDDRGKSPNARLFSRLAVLALALIPLVILILNVAAYQVDVPFWDQWNFVPLLDKSYGQGVTLADLWAQHNEHRLLFPRLIMLGLAHASGYDIAFELAVIVLLAAATFAFLWHQFLRTRGALGDTGFPWAIPVMSLLVFSLNQAENWLWGWQIQIFLNVLAVVAGAALLGGGPFRWRNSGGAFLCGLVATYSFANGLLFWPMGFLTLMLVPFEKRRQKERALAFWAAGSAAVIASYLFQFRYDSPSGTAWTQFLVHPGEYLSYLFIYLGRPVINYQKYALAFGILGFLLFALLCLRYFLKKRDELLAVLPFFLLGLYAIGSAVLTGIGRVGFGSAQAMDGRYVPFSSLLWISNFVLLFLFSREIPAREGRRGGRILGLTGVGILAFVLVFWIGRTSFRVGHRVFKSYHARMLPARQELLQGEDDERLLRLYKDADYVRRGIDLLKKHKLSVFRKAGP